jgi:hypothetical protein
MTIGRSLVVHRRPGKGYVHGAELFDALTAGFGGWRRARLRFFDRLEGGTLVLPVEEARHGVRPTARLQIERMGRPLEFLLLPLPHQPAPVSSQCIPEDDLLAGTSIGPQECHYARMDHNHPFGLRLVTAALEVLWARFPEEEWLLAEMDLPNPEGWLIEVPLSVRLRQDLGRKFMCFSAERLDHLVGHLYFTRFQHVRTPR